jgi:uncharacterized protein (DUF58 family)
MNSRLVFLLIAFVGSWVLAFNGGNSLAYGMAYLTTGVLVFSYLWARNGVRSVNVRRVTKTRRSQVGQFAEEQMEVLNRGFWPKLWLELDDDSSLPWHVVGRVISSLGRKSTMRWQVRTLCTQRGRFRLGPMTLRSGDPLGIFEMERTLPGVNFIIVYPLTVDLPSFQPSISDLAGGEARHRRTYQMTTNAAGVRDYAPGDSLNRIHWPTTVRVRRLMVKEFELDPTADIWLYLDLQRESEAAMPWAPSAPEPGMFAIHSVRRQRSQFELPPATTEYAVTVTASLARYFVMRNRAVGMSSRGRTREFLQADRGERQLNKILEALAVVEAVGDLPFAQLIATDGVRLNRNDTVVAVSSDPSREWAAALQQLQRRGINSIAVVIDAQSFGKPVTYESLLGEFEATGIPVYLVRRSDPIEHALATPFRAGRSGRSAKLI